MSKDEWQLKLAETMLKLLTKKWKLRCELSNQDGEIYKRERCLKRYNERRRTLPAEALLVGDRYLLEERFRPGEGNRLTTMREWERTLGLAIEARKKTD